MTFGQRAALRIAVLAAAVAFAVSAVSFREHVADPDSPSICAVSARIDCRTVYRSRYATVLGVPISLWGMGVYAGILVAAAVGLRRPAAADGAAAGIAATGIASVAYSAFLFYVSHRRLHVVCLLCHALYILNVAIALAGIWAVRAGAGLRATLRAEARRVYMRPVRSAVALAALVAVAVAVPSMERQRRLRVIEASEYGKIVRGEWPRIPPERLPIGGRPSKGPADAPVVIVEFADFECPFCADARFVLDDIVASLPVRLVFMAFPSGPCNPALSPDRWAHPFACAAAAAAEIAHREGRFWPLHEAIFARPHLLRTEEGRRTLAREAGLADDLFDRILADTAARNAVVRDAIIAGRAGIVGTPTIFINGMGFAGLPPPWMLHEMVRREAERVRRGEVDWRPVE